MASEIRVDKINSLSGVGTVTLSPTGVDIAGITTAATLKATTGIVTTLTATTGIVTNFTANAVNIGIDTGVYGEDLVVTGNTRVTGITTFGDSDNPALMLNIDATSGLPAISIPDSIIHSGDTNTKIRFPSADTFSVETAGLERLRVGAGGSVGIGENEPDSLLHIGKGTNADDGTVTLTIGGSSANTRQSTITKNNVAADNRALEIRAATGGSKETIKFFSDYTTETLRIQADGDVNILDGNLKFASGHGIDFSATANSGGSMSSELLDDYEEGSWTPVISFGGGSTGITYTARDGEYTRIGRQVNVTFMVNLSDKGSSTGQATITGLPFTVPDLIGDTVIESSGSSSYWNNIDPDLMWMGFSCETTGGGQLSMRYQPETGASDAVSALSNSEFTDTTNFRGTITYFTS